MVEKAENIVNSAQELQSSIKSISELELAEQEPVMVETRSSATRQNNKKELSKEERMERERLLARYGYELEEQVELENGETEIVFKAKGGDKKQDPSDLLATSNRDIVRNKQAQERMEQKIKHEKEAKRNKEMLLKQKAAKELKSKGTQKREKVRG